MVLGHPKVFINLVRIFIIICNGRFVWSDSGGALDHPKVYIILVRIFIIICTHALYGVTVEWR